MTDAAAPGRRELPTDAATLPPMGGAFDAALDEGIRQLGLDGTRAGGSLARRAYEAHARLLREWNRAINLTAIREPSDVARRHVCDSLTAVPILEPSVPTGGSLLDIGSGGGYPGLPLAAALPLGRLGLLDSVAKKARFLGVAGAAVRSILAEGQAEIGDGGPTIDAIPERAEDLADEPDQRAAWDVVVARAVGPLSEVLELALPLTREGGLVVAWKREEDAGGLRAELRDAGPIIRAAGGGRPSVRTVTAAALPGHRLVVVAKERPTPTRYPRPPGVRRRGQR